MYYVKLSRIKSKLFVFSCIYAKRDFLNIFFPESVFHGAKFIQNLHKVFLGKRNPS